MFISDNVSNGFSFKKIYNKQIYCVDCDDNLYNIELLNQKYLIRNVCLTNHLLNISGGYGGGGASCGLLSGGGSGFTGFILFFIFIFCISK